MRKRERDNQKERVYAAERSLLSHAPISVWTAWDRNERHIRHLDAYYRRHPDLGCYDTSASRPEPELRPMTLPQVRSYVNDKVKSAWFQKTFTPWFGRMIVQTRKSNAGACCQLSGPTLSFPKWSRWPIVILHEMAHAVTSEYSAWHGSEFARNFITLVSHYLGTEAARELKAAFRKYRVDYRRSSNGTHRIG